MKNFLPVILFLAALFLVFWFIETTAGPPAA